MAVHFHDPLYQPHLGKLRTTTATPDLNVSAADIAGACRTLQRRQRRSEGPNEASEKHRPRQFVAVSFPPPPRRRAEHLAWIM